MLPLVLSHLADVAISRITNCQHNAAISLLGDMCLLWLYLVGRSKENHGSFFCLDFYILDSYL